MGIMFGFIGLDEFDFKIVDGKHRRELRTPEGLFNF
jgi:hypothetical protein